MKKIKTESSLMSFFRKLGFDSIAWSLRRLYCPVGKDDLVLEVGSGGNPYFRANVLCDAYFETQERFFVPLIYDRPTVIASAENLPFKDNAFDFVIASHVLEHSVDPKKFLEEIQRVGKAGYIEVPDAFMERLTNYGFHRLEITDINDMLIIRKKKGSVQDEELWEIFKNKARGIAPYLFSKYPFNFHVRYYWNKEFGGIKYQILNPEYKFDWDIPVLNKNFIRIKFNLKNFLKKQILVIIRKLFSQNKKNSNLDVAQLMMCGNCNGNNLNFKWGTNSMEIYCKSCGEKYAVYGVKNK